MMIEIDNMVVSSEILENNFCCDLASCLGTCCVYGQSGAPLEKKEIEILKKIYPLIKMYISKEGQKVIKKLGVAVIDVDNDDVTPLIEGKECAYCIFDNGISYCAIERAWLDKKIDFQKPISCHLYPIRVKKMKTVTALNYDRWDVCKPARILGSEKGLPVYKFLKDPIIRAYGFNFFEQLEEAAKLLNQKNC